MAEITQVEPVLSLAAPGVGEQAPQLSLAGGDGRDDPEAMLGDVPLGKQAAALKPLD